MSLFFFDEIQRAVERADSMGGHNFMFQDPFRNRRTSRNQRRTSRIRRTSRNLQRTSRIRHIT